MRAFAALVLAACCGCTIAPHGSRATHDTWFYVNGQLVRHDRWTDRSAGGGGQLGTFAKLNNVAVNHTNSVMQVGGTLTIGDAYIGVDTNTASTVTALGQATGDIIGAAAGTAARRAVGVP